MRKQRGGNGDPNGNDATLTKRTQSKSAQSTIRNKAASNTLLSSKLLPPGPPRSFAGAISGSSRNSQFCISSSSMGVRRTPSSRIFIISKGRFGKRPPTLTAECVGPAIDSEDSGFGCDFQSSESQLSWSNDDAAAAAARGSSNGGGIGSTFGLSRTLSNSNLSSNSSQISTTSSTTSSSSSSSFTLPQQFSTSSPEKQFLTSLLHESLAQEDAVDPFDGVFYTTAASSSGALTSTSPSSSATLLSLSDSGISCFPTSSATSSSSTSLSPVSILGELSPATVSESNSVQASPKLLLILPGGTTSSPVCNQQPLDFAQVFGKLSSTASPPTTTTHSTVTNTLVTELLQNKTAAVLTKITSENLQHHQQQQLTSSDRNIIKIEPENMKLPPPESILPHNESETESNHSFQMGPSIFSQKNGNSQPSTHSFASGFLTTGTPAPTQASPPPPTLALSAEVQSSTSFNKLKDILIESSREAAELEGAENSNHGCELNRNSTIPGVSTASDPMLILSQAVNLQKELFEEPALDGIPITVKGGNNINGFGFNKSGLPTAAATATTVGDSGQGISTTVKNLVLDSANLGTTSSTAQTLVAVVAQQQSQTPQVLESSQSMKLMQLTENGVRMSPESGERITIASTVPFAAHQIGGGAGTLSSNPLGPNSTSPLSTTSSSSPIPMKRTRFSFPHPGPKGTGLKLRNQNHNQNYMPARSVGKRLPPGTTPTLTSILSPFSRDVRAQLQIVSQPEEQHRARYQTEGSRGAIKDRKGNGFPTVKLVGYDKPATLQIFIGTDQGKVSPHMFYQACKVTGKSSTPCIEKKVEGTILIEIEFEPSKEMVISCDCVGILKERNVDVEQRFPFHHAAQSRKKSTKCRMIFRTTIMNSDGMEETLQVASLPILCTQPPGVPEICKQSLTECPAKGGLEMFIVGKNFLKDTRVVFQQEDTDGRIIWEASSEPLKDYLQQNHLITVIPPFKEEKLVEPVECKVTVVSGGKQSEPHRFMYLPELLNVHLGGVPSALSSCLPNSPNSPTMLSAATMIQQIPNGSGLMPMDIQPVGVNTIIPSRDGLVKSIITPSPESCSPISSVSIQSPDGSMHSSSGSQPSPPATATTLNSLTSIGFQNAAAATALIQATTPVTAASLIQGVSITATADTSPVVNTFLQAATVAAQQQQAEAKPVVGLIKATAELLDAMKSDQTTTTSQQFPGLTAALQPEKPVTTSTIPLDLQFPTQDMPTTEAPATMVTTVNNPFTTTEQQINCITLPQLINGMGMNGATTSSPAVMSSTVPVSNQQQQQPNISVTSANDVVMGTVATSVPATVALTVADCLGQAIIKAEPTSMDSSDIGMNMNNNSVNAVTNGSVSTTVQQQSVAATTTTTSGPPPNGAVMTLVPSLVGELQPHQGPIANALSQLTDNELINYINPNCFDGPLL